MAWKLNKRNRIVFVLNNAAQNMVSGLGTTFTLQVAKPGDTFQASAGDKAEIGSGWYTYHSTTGEADTEGLVSVRVTGTGVQQQNLYYLVS